MLGFSIHRVDPYNVRFSQVLECTDAILDGFNDDDLYAAIFRSKMGVPVGLPQRISYTLKVWEQLMDTTRTHLILRESEKPGRVLAFSTWKGPVPPLYQPNLLSRFNCWFMGKLVHTTRRFIDTILSITRIAADPDRKAVSTFFTELERNMPEPEDCKAHLSLLVVRSQSQRKGLGRALLEKGIQLIEESIARDPDLKTWKMGVYASPSGSGLYSQYGFKTVGTFKSSIESYDLSPSRLMLREVPATPYDS